MGFQRPELLLLLLPAAWLWWWARDRELGTLIVRAVVLLLLVGALASPYLSISSPGRTCRGPFLQRKIPHFSGNNVSLSRIG